VHVSTLLQKTSSVLPALHACDYVISGARNKYIKKQQQQNKTKKTPKNKTKNNKLKNNNR